jgi:hypothetical protein
MREVRNVLKSRACPEFLAVCGALRHGSWCQNEIRSTPAQKGGDSWLTGVNLALSLDAAGNVYHIE